VKTENLKTIVVDYSKSHIQNTLTIYYRLADYNNSL